MGRAFSAFAFDRTPADFDRRNKFYHKLSDSYFTMLRRGGEAFMRRHQIGPAGEEINVVEKRIDYIMGSGHTGQTLIHRSSRNELIELPVAWYIARGGYWAMNPNYDQPNHEGFRRRIRYDCFFCHNGYPDMQGQPDDFLADPIYPAKLPSGIDCQRCHGPALAHVEAAVSKQPVEKIRSLVVNPKRQTRDQQMEICLQCHLQSTSSPLPHTIVKTGRGVFSHRAGEPLGDYAAFFDHPAGAGYDDKFEIAHAGYRLRQSACFRKSQMTCTTCHNPHDVKRADEAIAAASKACRNCHAQVSPAAHRSPSECISCHMPQRRTEDAVEIVMTDHRIVRRPPPGDLTAPRKEPHGEAYRGAVAAYYPANIDAVHMGIAQVRTGTNLSGGIAMLKKAAAGDSACGVECLFELSEAYGKAGRFEDAATIAERILKNKPDHLYTLRSYGTYLSAKGDLVRGAELLEKALKQVPDHPRTRHDLGLNYARQGRQQDAVKLMRQALQGDPDSPEIHFSLASILSSGGDLAGAAAELREAVRSKPTFGQAHANLAALLTQQNDTQMAEFHWREALRWEPDNARIRHLYGMTMVQKDPVGAITHFEAAVKLDPSNLDSRFYLGVLLAGSGQSKRAVEHLQIASKSPNPSIRERAAQALQMIAAQR